MEVQASTLRLEKISNMKAPLIVESLTSRSQAESIQLKTQIQKQKPRSPLQKPKLTQKSSTKVLRSPIFHRLFQQMIESAMQT